MVFSNIHCNIPKLNNIFVDTFRFLYGNWFDEQNVPEIKKNISNEVFSSGPLHQVEYMEQN